MMGLTVRVLSIGYTFSRMTSVLKKRANIASRACMAAKKLRLLKIQTIIPLLIIFLAPSWIRVRSALI